MIDNSKKYSFTLPDGRTGVWTEEQMQKGRDALYKKYPDAQVVSLTEHNAAQGIDDDAMYVVDTGDGRTSTWDSSQMRQGYDALLSKYPQAKVMRAKNDTYWQDKAAEQTDALNKFDADNKEFFRQHEKDTALYNTGEASRIDFDEEGYLERDRQYKDLQAKRQQMEIERANNPYIKAMYEAQSRKSDEDIARYDKQIAALKSSDNKDKGDLRNLRQARKLARDTKDVYDVDVADSNDGFADYVRNMGQGAGDVFSDADFWTRGLTSIARNINIHGIEKRLNKDGRSLYDLTEEEIDKELTPSEKDLFLEFIRNASAQAERAGNMARGYTAGQTAAESIGYMTEFIATAGVAKGIGSALSAAESGLGKWIARELTGKTAQAITNTAGKAAYNVVARPAEKAIFHTALHPTTYSSIAEALTQIDDNGQLVDAGNAIASTVLDQIIENWSESIGEPLEKILPTSLLAKGVTSKSGQRVLSKIGKADWAKMWVDSDVHKVLMDAGFNGLVGEMAEEWAGNAVRLSVGLMDKDDFAKFASWDEQVDMMASFAPMTLFGLGSQSVAVHRIAKERNANLALVRDALTRQGWTEQEISNVLDNAHTKDEIKEILRPVVNNIVSQRTNGGAVTTDYMAMLDFARINEMDEILDEAHKYERDQSRAAMRQTIEMELGATEANPDSGKFTHMMPSVNDDGTTSEQEMVTTVTDEDGNLWYLIGRDNAKVMLRKKGDTSGQPFFVTDEEYAERLTDGSYKEYTTTVDEYLDSEVEAQRKAQETRRINDAVTAQYDALNKRLMQEPTINLGTDESPKTGIIQAVRRDGVIVSFETPTDLGAGAKLIHKISLDEAMNAIGESSVADTRTDDQIARDEADREYVQEQRLKQINRKYNNASVTVNGDLLTIERVADMPYNTEDGTEVVKVAARNASGEINDIVVPVADIQVNDELNEENNTDVTVDTNLDFRGNPLPMKTADDGTTLVVDDRELWRRDPEAYLRWNDAQRNGVTTNSMKFLSANIDSLQRQRAEIEKKQAANLDPPSWQAYEDEKVAMENKINTLTALYNRYLQEQQYSETVTQINQQMGQLTQRLLETKTPEQTAEINDKIDDLRRQYYEVSAQSAQGQALANRKVQIMEWTKDYADMPVKPVDMGNVIDIVTADNATPAQIAQLQDMVNYIFSERLKGKNYVINGLHLNGVCYLFAEGCINEETTKRTYFHERQHEINERTPDNIQQVIESFGGNRDMMEVAVGLLSDTDVYAGKSASELADEILSFSLEKQYIGKDMAGELHSLGFPAEYINFVTTLYGEQTKDGYRLPKRQDNGAPSVGNYSVTGRELDGATEETAAGDGRYGAAENGSEADRERIRGEVESLFADTLGPVFDADGEVVAIHNDGETPKFSIRTWNESGRDALIAYLTKQVDSGEVTKEEADNLIAEMDRLTSMAKELDESGVSPLFSQWSYEVVRKKDGTEVPVLHALKKNSEYELNIDFSTVCKKRRVIDYLFNRMIREGDLIHEKLSPADIARMNQIIQKHGLEIACGICFVDSKRYNAYRFAEGFLDKFNPLVSSLMPGVDVAGFNYSNNVAFNNDGKPDLTNVSEIVDWSKVFTYEGDNPAALDEYQLNWKAIYRVLKPLYDKARAAMSKPGFEEKFQKRWYNDHAGRIKDDLIAEAKADGKKLAKKDISVEQINERLPEPTNQDRLDFAASLAFANKNSEQRMALEISQNPNVRKLAKAEDFIASEGWTNILQSNEALETLWNVQKGAAGARPNEDNTQYKSEVLAKGVNGDIYDIAGYRMQSFSDFIGHMYFDYMQAFADLAAMGLPGHAYTKEPAFVKLFGLMGMKVNMSLVSDVDIRVVNELGKDYAGLTYGPNGELTYNFYVTVRDADGNIVRQGQTFPPDEAFALQDDELYTKNVGTIAVGLSRQHILKMLRDPRIRMVIPYHSSGLPHGVALVYNLNEINDYTKVQSTRGKNGVALSDEEKKIAYARVDHYNFILHQLSIAEDKTAAYNAMRILFVQTDASKVKIHERYEELYNAIVNGGITTGLVDRQLSDRYDSNDFIPKVAADIYIEACDRWGYEPKFFEFANEQAYYKVLIDFAVYDKDGNYTPQEAIKFRVPDNVVELISEALAEDEAINDAKMRETDPIIKEWKNYLANRKLRQEQDRIAEKDDDKITEEELSLMRTNIYNVGDPRNIPTIEEAPATDIGETPEMKESVMEGQPMFRATANYRSLEDIRNNPNGVNKLLREGKINRNNYNSAVSDLKLNPLLSYLNKNDVYLPYRKVFKTVSINDYYIGTEATFEPVSVENELGAKWDELKKMEGFRLKKSPLSNSEYLVNEETGDIYRYSDHWGTVASCSWKLNGLDNKTTAIGKANIKDFKPIYSAGAEVINPKAIENYGPLLEQTIANYEGILRDESFDIDDVAREKLQSAIGGNKELLEWWKEESQKENPQLRRPMFRTTEQREQLFADVKDEFGTTRDFREAGYLLPDGSMLDFSEKNNGGEPGRRGADHRDIARVINDRSYDTMTEYLDDFINEGAIRLIPESGAFSVAQQPTKEQKNMLRNFIYRYNGEVEVEIYKNGHSVADPYYRERTSPTRILNDIDAYFNEGVIPEGNAPMFRAVEITPEVREEMDSIIADAKANGTYLKAPNGADTNLNPEQWAMVRTKKFKAWFGDWENDPENASKVVDENGEPRVVYHGLKGNDFNVFDKDIAAENSRSSQPVYGAFFFSDNKDNASAYGTKSDNGVRSLNGLKEVFLKADNPFVVDANGEQYHSVKAYFKERDTGEINWERGGIVMDGNEVGVQDITIAARDLGYDSVIFKNIDDPGSEDFVGKPQTTIAVFSPTQIKSATDNTGSFNPTDPDIRYRVTPSQDAEYMSAVESGDMEKAEMMVRDAAKSQDGIILDDSGNPKVLYHGTSQFGFTEFVPIKAAAIWTSTARNVAANYAGNGYASVREIRKGYSGIDTTDGIIADIEYLTGQKWRRVTDEERQNLIDNIEQRAVEICGKFNEVVEYDLLGDEEERAKAENAIAWVENLFWEVADAKANGWSNNDRYNYIKSSVEHYREERAFLRDYRDKHYGELSEPTKGLIDYLLHWEVGDLGTEISFSYLAAVKPGDALTTDYEGSSIVTPESLRNTIERNLKIGAYQLFGFAYNILEVDCQNNVWYNIDFNGMHNTDEIAVWAKQNGYDAVHFKNIYDYGDLADDYCFFSSNQVKSADAVTYDDGGNVIPLSERFNPESNDIRFSVANTNQDIFISNALASLDKIPMKSGNAQAWINKIQQAGGLKKEEDKWIGLTDWLKEQAGNISKEDVSEYIREHQVQIEEVHYAGGAEDDAENTYAMVERMLQEKFSNYIAEFYEQNNGENDDLYGDDSYEYALDKLRKEMNDEFPYAIERSHSDVYLTFPYEETDDLQKWADKLGINFAPQNPINSTRLDYTTDGLIDKREIALVVPTIASYNESDEIHFGDAGEGRAVAWARFGETVDENGNRVLVIDEIQSKRHQEGKENGYKDRDILSERDASIAEENAAQNYNRILFELLRKYSVREVADGLMSEEDNAYYKDALEKKREAQRIYNLAISGVPDAPFRDSWDALAMKRMLRLAAEEGYDKIAWTSGQMQSDRYSLTKRLENFYYKPNADGTYKVSATLNQRRHGYTDYSELNYDTLTIDRISEIFGKEIASKVSDGKGRKGYSHNNEGEWTTFSGRDLKIINDGMRYFYDQKLVNWMNKYGKKWGVQVIDMTLPNLENREGWHSVDVTPEMKESVMQGQVMFSVGSIAQQPEVENESLINEPVNDTGEEYTASALTPISYRDIQQRLINDGLAEVGEEEVSDLMMDVFSNSDESVRNDIIKVAPRFDYSLSKATGEYFSTLALKDALNGSEMAAINKMRDVMRDAIGTDNLSAADALWIMYRTMGNPTANDIFAIARDTEVASRLGHSAQGIQARRQAEDAVRMSVTEAMHSQSAAEMYNQSVAYWRNRLKEGYVDMYESVNDLMSSMEKATGHKAEEYEDIRIALNQQSSKALDRMKRYTADYLEPLWEAIGKAIQTSRYDMDGVIRYVELKHALERNDKFAKRDAIAFYQEEHDKLVKPLKDELNELKKGMKKAVENGDADEELRIGERIDIIDEQITDHDNSLSRHIRRVENGTSAKYRELRENDYAGLTGLYSEYPGLLPRNKYKTDEEYNKAARKVRRPKYDTLQEMENEAQHEIDIFEAAAQKEQVDNLWERINAATKETLRSQYASGIISRAQYNSVKDMFDYYVPLRGFKDDVAEDIWSYYTSAPSGSFSAPVITAKGRKSEAENPFLWIGTMASSAIAQNMKNESKLALYYYAMNNPQQDLVKVQDMWYELDVAETASSGRKVFVASYPPLTAGMTPEDAVNVYNAWEESMRQKASVGQAYTRHGNFSTNGEVAFIDNKKKAEHFIRVKANGRDMIMYVNGSPRAAQAINGLLNVENTTDYKKVFGGLLRLMSSLNTSWNPEFWISNMQRDLLFATMSMDIKGDGAKDFRQNLVTPARMMRLSKAYADGTLNELKGKDAKYAQYFKEFAEGGAITGYTVVKSNEVWEKEIDSWMKSNGVNYDNKGKDPLRGVKSVVKSFFGKFSDLGEAVEQMTRFSAFVTARKAGKSIADSVNDAKEISVNFNRKGSGKAIEWKELDQLIKADGTRLNNTEKAVVYAASLIPAYGRRTIMFFNAAIQGLNAMYKLWEADKRKTAKWMAGYFTMGVLQAVIHSMLDDDDEYLNIPEYTRRANAMIGAGGIYFKWALPQESRLFYAAGDILVQRALGNEKERGVLPNIAQGAFEIINQALDLLPINPAGGITDILPSLAQPLVENYINKDFTGANVYYENKFLSEDERERTPKFINTKRGTSGWAINAAKLLNYISGGDSEDAGWWNWHPESIQNFVEGVGGGTFTTIGKLGDTVNGLAGTGDLTVRRTLFINRILELESERSMQYHTNELYRFYKGEAEHTKTKLKKYKKMGALDDQADLMGSDDYEIYLIFERYRKMLEPYEEQLKIEESSEEKRVLNREMDALKREMIHEISNL